MNGVTDCPDNPTRTLLLVSYWYPPAVGAAAERIGALATYLPRLGWRVCLVTARRPGGTPDTKGTTVLAIPDRLAPEGQPFPDYDPRKKPSRFRALLRDWIFPDRFVAWRRAALEPALEVIRRQAVDLILVSFPPASAVQLALRLHERTRVPLVLDLRDRWLGPGGHSPRRRGALLRHRRLERRAISRAAALVTVSNAMADAVAREHGFDRSGILVVPNGYEPTDAPTRPQSSIVSRQSAIGRPLPYGRGPDHGRSPDEDRGSDATARGLTIAHVGSVIPRNRPDLFFQSIRAIQGHESLRDVTFRFVGNLSQAYLDDAGLSPLVQTTGLLPRDRALAEMHGADALLLLTGRYVGRWGYNAKLFEYLRTGRPILCLEETPGSNDSGLLEQFAAGRAFFAPMDEPGAIVEQLDRIKQYLAKHPDPVAPLPEAFEAFSRPNLTAKLAGHLNRIIHHVEASDRNML